MGVRISFLIGLKAATLFIFFASLRNLGFTLVSIPILYASLVSLLVAIASHPSINLPMLQGKGSDGKFPTLVMFSPYLDFVRAFSAVRRFTSRVDPYSKISEKKKKSLIPNLRIPHKLSHARRDEKVNQGCARTGRVSRERTTRPKPQSITPQYFSKNYARESNLRCRGFSTHITSALTSSPMPLEATVRSVNVCM